MSSGAMGSSGGGSKGRMMLRCLRPNLPPEEVYLARKLSIGRAVDNVFVIEDSSVDRHHAEVDLDNAGRFVLRTVYPGASVETENGSVETLLLEPGVRFRVGIAQFECVGADIPLQSGMPLSLACPFCSTSELPPVQGKPQACPRCRRPIMVVAFGGSKPSVVLPARVRNLEAIRFAGKGGMGFVLQGRVSGTGRKVALKFLLPSSLGQPGALERFRREIAMMQKVRHPHVVRILGWGKWGAFSCLVLQWIEGKNLRTVIEENREKGIPFSQALVWLWEIVGGLTAVHEAGLVHRDIKPSNILIERTGKALLADLGLAKQVDAETTELTRTGVTVGTWVYTAPEQFRMAEVDPRADQYSLGVTWYELLTGAPPVGRWIPVSQANPTVPPQFDAILARLLAAEPQARYPSLRHLVRELAGTFEPPAVSADRGAGTPDAQPPKAALPPPLPGSNNAEETPRKKTRATDTRWRVSMLVISLLVALLAIGGYFVLTRTERANQPAEIDSGDLVGVVESPGSRRTERANQPAEIDWPAPRNPITSIAFSPDGRQVLAGSIDGTAILWDVDSGQRLRTFRGHTDIVWSVAFSPSGKQVLTGSLDRTAILWDVDTGQRLRTFQGHTSSVSSVVFSPNGKQVLTGSDDKTAILWDVDTGQRLRTFQGHTSSVRPVAFSPDGRQVLTGSYDGTAILWDVDSGQRLRTFLGHTGSVSSPAFSPDGRQILTGSIDGTAILWDVDTGQRLRTFQGHTNSVTSVAFSPDGRQVLTADFLFGTAILWDVDTGQRLRTFQGHTSGVRSVTFSPSGKQVLIGSYDETAILWDVDTGQRVRTFQNHADFVLSVAFSPDGRQVLTGSYDRTAILWDVDTGQRLRTFRGHTGGVRSVAFSPSGRQVLTGSRDKTAILWDVDTGQRLETFQGHTDTVGSVAFSPSGRQVLTGSLDKTVILWDVDTGQRLRTFRDHTGGVRSVAFSPSGRQALASSVDGTAILWDVDTGRRVKTFRGHANAVTSVAFSPSGRQVLTGSLDRTAILWDVGTGQRKKTFRGHTGFVWSVAFSPDGRQVLTGSFGGTAILWDVDTGQRLRTFRGHTRAIESVAFSPSGRQVLTGSRDGTARLWDTENGKWIAAFLNFDGGKDWLIVTPEGFFDGSTGGIALLRLTDPVTHKPLAETEKQAYHVPEEVRRRLSGGK